MRLPTAVQPLRHILMRTTTCAINHVNRVEHQHRKTPRSFLMSHGRAANLACGGQGDPREPLTH